MFTSRLQTAAVLGFVAFALSGCVNLKVETNHEPAFDFSKWKTFGYAEHIPEPAIAAGVPKDREPPIPIVKQNLERVLAEKGYRKAPRDRADFEIFIRTGTWAKPRYKPGDKGIEGQLTVRFTDRASGEIAWEGHAHETWLSHMDSREEIRKAVDRLLDGYPPR